MYEEYERALQKIKEMDRIITEKEWNQIAKAENYMSAASIKYFSKKSLRELCEELINKND